MSLTCANSNGHVNRRRDFIAYMYGIYAQKATKEQEKDEDTRPRCTHNHVKGKHGIRRNCRNAAAPDSLFCSTHDPKARARTSSARKTAQAARRTDPRHTRATSAKSTARGSARAGGGPTVPGYGPNPGLRRHVPQRPTQRHGPLRQHLLSSRGRP